MESKSLPLKMTVTLIASVFCVLVLAFVAYDRVFSFEARLAHAHAECKASKTLVGKALNPACIEYAKLQAEQLERLRGR